MDGFVKHKQGELRELRRAILWKYAITLVVFLPVFLVVLCFLIDLDPPEKWRRTEVVYSYVDEIPEGRGGSSHRLYTSSGQVFRIYRDLYDTLEQEFHGGETCKVTYSIFGGMDRVEAFATEEKIYISETEALQNWRQQRNSDIHTLLVWTALEVVAIVLIDRLWCRGEYAQIRKVKERIRRREQQMMGKK